MIKYFVKPGISQMVQFDTETEEINGIDYLNSHIDWIYMVPEDGVIDIDNSSKNVKKGDFIIKFYQNKNIKQNNPIVIKSKEWKQNIAAEKAYEDEVREKYALKESESCCCDCEKCAA